MSRIREKIVKTLPEIVEKKSAYLVEQSDGTHIRYVSDDNGNLSRSTILIKVDGKTPNRNGEIEVDFPVINALNIGTGSYIFDGLENKNLKFSSLKSNTLNIKKETDGTINIDSIDKDFGYLKSFYVNNAYKPTVDSPSDGSIIRPYVSFEDALRAYIGKGTFYNPEFEGSTIILQTSADTSVNPSVRNLRIRFENNSMLTYTGTDEYMFDTEKIYPHVEKGFRGELKSPIKIVLTGIGTITRNNGVGLVRCIGVSKHYSNGNVNDYTCTIVLGEDNQDIISLRENIEYPKDIWEGEIYDNYSNITWTERENFPHYYTTKIRPTIPLIYAQNNGFGKYSFPVICYGSLYVNTFANTGIYFKDCTFLCQAVKFDGAYGRVATTNPNPVSDSGLYSCYEPLIGKYFIDCDSANFDFRKIELDEYWEYNYRNVDSFIKMRKKSLFLRGDLKIKTNIFMNNFIDLSDCEYDSLTINTNKKDNCFVLAVNCRYLLKNNNKDVYLSIVNSSVTAKNISKDKLNLALNTEGSFSVFFEKPVISGLPEYNDNQDGINSGAIVNTLYYNKNNKSINIIN